jgi:S-adenosylmethionine synthetase
MIFTSESVSAGHPDKVCDVISPANITSLSLTKVSQATRAFVSCVKIASNMASDICFCYNVHTSR